MSATATISKEDSYIMSPLPSPPMPNGELQSAEQHPAKDRDASRPASPPASPARKPQKPIHATAMHSKVRTSCLSHDSVESPSFIGFRNLMVIVLVAMNLRLVIENFMKYGVLICIQCHNYSRQDVKLSLILLAVIPCHLFVAYLIEVAAAWQAKNAVGRAKRNEDDTKPTSAARAAASQSLRSTWTYIAWLHSANATLALLITTVTVYTSIFHPLLGTISQVHAIIVWLKICSYAFTNRDLRYALLKPEAAESLPQLYLQCPYPRNITLTNLIYFWWAPTLVYQPVYPRSASIRWIFVLKRISEGICLSIFIWLASAQYAAPLLHNSLAKMSSPANIIERIMKLSTVSLIIWLAGFFAVFQSFLNALAEVMRFGDREFYTEWWNSPSVGAYWRTWNKPVYNFMRRHVFGPMVARGWHPVTASVAVFVFSGVLHELLVGVPTHNIIGVAFLGMILQIPMIWVTMPLEKRARVTDGNSNSKVLGNCIFWISFCLVGQPLAALLYFFAWQAKYGSVSKQVPS